MFRITRRDIEHGFDIARRNVGKVSGDFSGGGRGLTKKFIESVEIVGSAFGVGVLSGRFGPLTVSGTPVPVDLGGAVALHMMNLLMDTGRLEPHLSNVANGVGAAWATKAGVGVGTDMRVKKGLPPVSVSGTDTSALPAASPRRGPLTEAELMALASKG